MATLSSPSRNPFRTNPFTPNPTGNSSSTDVTPPPPSFSAPVTPPPTREADRAPERNLGFDEPVDEPPPYTVRPAMGEGEITIEQGPRRPFQPAPAPQVPQAAPRPQALVSQPTGHSSYSSLSLRRDRPGGLLHQLTGALNSVVDSLNERTQGGSYGGSSGAQRWNSYPGQQASPTPSPPQQRQYAPPSHPPPGPSTLAVPPPLPPRRRSTSLAAARSPTVSPTPSSDFARDFYAVGPADDILRREGTYTPPPGPPPGQRSMPDIPGRPSRPTSLTERVPDDGRPTTQPVIGHPLLKDGKLLVYPEHHECDKCHNIGYKNSDPLRPCKRCWKKHAKPFAGPLAYSFTHTARDARLQRPLRAPPPPAPPPIPPAFSLSPPPPHFAAGGYMTDHHGGFYTPPTGVRPSGVGRPPPGAVVYTAGDPRIGGRLCWRCDGKGNTSFFLLDRITCEVCGGIGRTF